MEEIRQLKNMCHHYLDMYVISNLRISSDKKHYQKQKRNAYHRLAQEMKTDAFKCHFSNMDTTEELEIALSILKSWR